MARSVAWLCIVAVLGGLLGCGLAALHPGTARAQGEVIVVSSRPLSQVGEQSPLTISGSDVRLLYENSATATIRLEGPAAPEEVGKANVRLPLIGESEIGTSARPVNRVSSIGGEYRLPVVQWGEERLAAPGAYRVTVLVSSQGETVAAGSTWVGKVAPRESPLELAFVWPLALGIHRDAEGVYFDRVLERGSEAGISALLGLGERFPFWRHTLAVEPVLLAQLRDMADGYWRLDASGVPEKVEAKDAAARSATATLMRLATMAVEGEVGLIALPYASPDLAVLAAEGWRDGLEQLQLGKQELVQTLGLEAPPAGAYVTGIGLTPASLATLAAASVDYVVVDDSVASSLGETPPPGTVVVRVRNEDHDRVTLVLADRNVRAAAAPPWDAGVFFARLAAVLAAKPTAAMVIAPAIDYGAPPQEFLDALGKQLATCSWITTVTVPDLLRGHPPDSRPLLLKPGRDPGLSYIGESLLCAVSSAHAAIADLASILGPTRTPVEDAWRLLYAAESRWWYRLEVSPQEASVGLKYALKAEQVARAELEKVAISTVAPPLIWGRKGEVRLALENRADHPMRVGLHLSGEGLELVSAPEEAIELEPGLTEVVVGVSAVQASSKLHVRLLAGTRLLAEESVILRFVILSELVPWLVLGGLVLAGITETGILLLRRRRRS